MKSRLHKNNIRQLFLLTLCAVILLVWVVTSNAQKTKPKPTAGKSNAVCPDPKKPCNHRDKEFDVWELSFRLPAKIVPNKTYQSAPFYAIILKKYDGGCEELDVNPVLEPERIKLQKKYPTRKVFAEYSCPNMNGVGYDFSGKMDAKREHFLYMDYIAIYAGTTPQEANQLLETLRGDFPNAEVKKMTANWELMEQ